MFIKHLFRQAAQTQFSSQTLPVWLQDKLAAYGFVPREDFDIQSKVLHQTKAQLAALETRLAALEAQQTLESRPECQQDEEPRQ